MDQFQATLHQLNRAVIRIAPEAFMAKESQLENKELKCVVQQVKKIESVEPPHPYYDEPPSYHEPFLSSNEPSYPPQPLMHDTLGVLLQGQREMERGVLEFATALTKVVNQFAS